MNQLGERLAEGRTADVHMWREGMVLKLFRSWFPAEDAAIERQLAVAVSAQGLPVPQVGDVVVVNGRVGLEYEWIDGPTMSEVLRAKPWLVGKMARRLARLHRQIHQVQNPRGLPIQRERLLAGIRAAPGLQAHVKENLQQQLIALPLETRLCHGDFHPGNIVLSSEGPVIIDWINASIGNPGADVGRTLVLLEGDMAISGGKLAPESVFLKLFMRAYRKWYYRLQGSADPRLEEWRPILAAARMAEGIEELNPWLLGVVREGEKDGHE